MFLYYCLCVKRLYKTADLYQIIFKKKIELNFKILNSSFISSDNANQITLTSNLKNVKVEYKQYYINKQYAVFCYIRRFSNELVICIKSE